MQAAGVPVVPGYQGADDDASLVSAASMLEYPLLIKAASGGGGKGMRLVSRAAGYQNAGTIEFIVDPRTRAFFFLEMNTRLQVEHPITELVTGLDLVQWQIRIATGEPFPYSQSDLRQRGHAIECRLYAEDPANGFLPSSGALLRFIEPAGPGVRIDSGFNSGDQMTTYYDPLIAKLITSAEDRPTALRRMQTALKDTVLLGIPTNWQFLQDVLAHPDFQIGVASTTWVEETFAGWQPPLCSLPPEVVLAAALTQRSQTSSLAGCSSLPDPYSPWRHTDSFRMGHSIDFNRVGWYIRYPSREQARSSRL